MGSDHTCMTAVPSRRQTGDDRTGAPGELPLTEEDRHDGEKQPQRRSQRENKQNPNLVPFPTVDRSERLAG